MWIRSINMSILLKNIRQYTEMWGFMFEYIAHAFAELLGALWEQITDHFAPPD